MFARVVTSQTKPEKVEEMIRGFREIVLPEKNKQKGLKQAYMLVNRQTGKSIAISLWENEQAVKEYEAVAGGMASQMNQAMSTTMPPTVEIYEVAVAKVPATAGIK